MEQIRLRAGQAKNMTCERSANSQPSNPEGGQAQKVRPGMGAESWPVHGQGSGPAGETPQPPAQTNRAYRPQGQK